MARLRKNPTRRGIMVIEAALLLPLLLLLTFGVIEYGWVLLKTQQITNATRHAARVAVRPDATNAEVEAATATLMSAVGISEYQLTLPANVGQVLPGETITVRISVAHSSVELAGPPFVPVPPNLEASVSMAKEGP